MAIISILKRKGGVGASTLAANLAGAFAAQGKGVRVLDCDAQHSVAAWSLYGDTPGILAGIVQSVDTERPSEFRAILDQAERDADLVLVDCAPGFPPTASAAASRADVVLIPSGPSPLDLEPAADALEVASEARAGRDRPRLALIPSKNLPRTRLGRDLPTVLAELGEPFAAIVVPGISQRVAIAEAVLCGQTVDEYEPDGEAAKEFAALAEAIRGLM